MYGLERGQKRRRLLDEPRDGGTDSLWADGNGDQSLHTTSQQDNDGSWRGTHLSGFDHAQRVATYDEQVFSQGYPALGVAESQHTPSTLINTDTDISEWLPWWDSHTNITLNPTIGVCYGAVLTTPLVVM